MTTTTSPVAPFDRRRLFTRVRPRRRPGGRRIELWAGVLVLGAVVASCVLVPLIDHTDPNAFVAPPFQAPSANHPFGTDSYGRDVFVRVFHAGRLDLVIATVALVLSSVIGTFVGMVAGASRARWVEPVAMRIVDAIVAFPFIVLTLAIVAVAGREWAVLGLPAGAAAVILSVVLVEWTLYARLARSQTLTLRDRDYVVAARTLGYSAPRIVLRHLLPGVGRTTASYAVADAILIIIWTASLSFLGLGIQAPAADWGSMMFEGRAVMSQAWWITTIPGAMIVLTGLALSAIGDSLLEVRSR
ncbi:ABC transporter permease [Amycolatopsis jejuensis]|uniref:ABC transporter permease n=1 Tax=Amycolatopsis jejuensis TaxID=330084 RepID=UPI00068F2601|nr:ABC transporter permease [Amycolatopsis jejuensis]